MAVLKSKETPFEHVRSGMQRHIIKTSNLMMVCIDFTDGPWAEAEPFHSHFHEQISYVAEGEIIFYCEGEAEQHLIPGDMFSVSSGKKHTIKLLTQKARLVDNFTPIREDFL